MNVAVAVLGYQHPTVLGAALPLYKAAGFEVFLHVDSKMDLNEYMRSVGPSSSACRVIPERTNIYWGGFSMVEAEMSLLRHISAVPEYDRVILVSDDTFPIVSPTKLLSFFCNPFELVMMRKLESTDPFKARYDKFFLLDTAATSLLGRPIENSNITVEILKKMKDLQKLMEIGKKEIDVYYGSQWWSLTRSGFEKVLWHYHNDFLLRKSLEYSAVPDELFVQTIVGNFVSRSQVRNGPVYVDWTRDPRPFLFVTEDQIPVKAFAEFAFLRKVSAKSHDIIQNMRDRLLKQL